MFESSSPASLATAFVDSSKISSTFGSSSTTKSRPFERAAVLSEWTSDLSERWKKKGATTVSNLPASMRL